MRPLADILSDVNAATLSRLSFGSLLLLATDDVSDLVEAVQLRDTRITELEAALEWAWKLIKDEWQGFDHDNWIGEGGEWQAVARVLLSSDQETEK